MHTDWLQTAQAMPLAFAQVREDPLLELELAQRAGPVARVCMVASGGCTLSLLALRLPRSVITAVDVNPAQLSHAQNKLQACALPPMARAALLQQPDQAGRYEQLFAQLQARIAQHPGLKPWVGALLVAPSLGAQRKLWAAAPQLQSGLLQQVRDTFDASLLVALFGEAATRNPRIPFATHFADRLAWAAEHLHWAVNPFVWQLLHGVYAPSATADWLQAEAASAMAEPRWVQQPIQDALDKLAKEDALQDLIHLSNTLDWLSDHQALAMLRSARRAAAVGCALTVRQLNSSIDLPALMQEAGWQLDVRLSEHWTQAERSFFYRRTCVCWTN